jgi:CHAT domain-containing protein
MKIIYTLIATCWCVIAVGQQVDIDELYRKGIAAYQKGDKQIAANLFNAIYQYDTTESLSLEYLTVVYGRLKKFDSALYNTKLLCKKFPDKDEVYSGASFYCTLLNKPKEAEAYGKRAVKLNGRKFNNLLNLGHAYLVQDKPKEAVYWYIKGLEWVNSKSEFERAFLGDFKMIDSLKLVDSTFLNAFVSGLKAEFASLNLQSKASVLLDSIKSYDEKSLSTEERQKLIEWKLNFIEEEWKSPLKRLNVLAAFYTDVGLYEYGTKRNRSVAITDYINFAAGIYLNAKDSLAMAKFYHLMSFKILVFLKSENEYVKSNDAYDYALEAKELVDKYGLVELKTDILSQLAEVCLQNDRDEEAIDYLHQLLNWGDIIKDGEAIFKAANKLSIHYEQKGNLDSALVYDSKALSVVNFSGINKESVLKAEINSLLLRLQTTKYLNVSILNEAKKLLARTKPYETDSYSDLCEIIGTSYTNLKSNDSAYTYYKKAVESYISYSKYKERQNKKNVTSIVSDERQTSIWSLADIAAQRGDYKDLFYWMEKMKDNTLRFFISYQYQPEYVTPLDTARKLLPANAAAITFIGNIRTVSPGLAFSKDKQFISWINQDSILAVIKKQGLIKSFQQLELLTQQKATTYKDSIGKALQLPLMQFFYLSNINPNASRGVVTLKRADDNTSKELAVEKSKLSHLLYDIYIKPFESVIKDKKTLYISADFLQHFIPFEALLMPDGRYLGEVYDVIYTPGFTINEYLNDRIYNKGSSIIAAGNPDYTTYKPEKLNGRALDYSNYGITSWNDLPGTKQELDMLKAAFDSVTVITQNELTETKLKKISITEQLKNAAILHFALHGLGGVATAKEDNSLVVSEPVGGKEDGLLQFFEAADLYIQPRLVCLSACETGLGMIGKDGSFSTMGTAFLVAGAKAVLVTNWKIDDAATALFMKDVYRQIKTGAIDFPEAIGNTKRKFIKGDFGETYKKPYYWAPFKYFGN